MDTEVLHLDLTVAEVLQKWPQTYSVFRRRNTNCIGCLLQRFCSIQEVAEAYELSPQELIRDLKNVSQE
jgi:hybrid cluster-associated redox disulfide protein